MSSWIEGIDLSVFQGYIPTNTWVDLYNVGQRVAVVGSYHGDAIGPNPHCEPNLANAKKAGFPYRGTYIVLDSPQGTTALQAVRRGRDLCGREWDGLALVALDVEVRGITVSEIMRAIEEVWRLGKSVVVYTAYWFWHDLFGNTQAFRDTPLWNANYHGRSIQKESDLGFNSVSYGGWMADKVIGEQWSGTTTLAGVEVDRNSFREDWLKQQIGEDNMGLREDVEKLREEVEAQQKFQNEIIVGNKTAIDFLAKIAVNHELRIRELEKFSKGD